MSAWSAPTSAPPPLPPHSFDLIVLNGVVEWLGLSDLTRDPRDVQVSLLASLRGLLRPGGCVYVGIENRIGYDLFLGARDHSGVRFTSLLPRVVASLYLRLLGRSGYTTGRRTARALHAYRTYTYSARGYRRLLLDAGYREVEMYCSMPHYNQPLVLIPTEHRARRQLLLHPPLGSAFRPAAPPWRWRKNPFSPETGEHLHSLLLHCSEGLSHDP